jgi:hypothetical protein
VPWRRAITDEGHAQTLAGLPLVICGQSGQREKVHTRSEKCRNRSVLTPTRHQDFCNDAEKLLASRLPFVHEMHHQE